MSRRRKIEVLAVMVVLVCGPTAPALAVTTHWDTDNNGDYDDINNWNNGAPDSNDIAVFDRGEGEAYTVRFPGHTVFQQPANYSSNRLIVRSNEVSFADITGPAHFADSYTVVNASLDESVRGIIIGQSAGDAAFLYSLLMNFSGVAATIGDAELSQGTLGVNAGTLALTGSSTIDDVLIVGNHGSGVLSISGGADVELIGADGDAVLGQYAGSFGSATISGPGSSLIISRFLRIGNGGNGTLAIDDGGSVSNVLGAYMAFEPGTTATAIVRGDGSIWNSSYLAVGWQGTGTLLVEDGATLSIAEGAIGLADGSMGTATVSGAGTTWINTGDLYIGDGGDGTLTIEEGASASGHDGLIGSSPGTTGIVTVTGPDSTWTLSNLLDVAFDGTATLIVEAGGAVSSLRGSIGDFPDGTGTATVTGTGSTWTNSANLFIGDQGAGTLNITAGGAVSNAVGSIGDAIGSNGTVLVDGPGSTWTNNASLRVGNNGEGSLTVTNGATVSSASAEIDGLNGVTGSVTVNGAGSLWTNSGTLDVGDSGVATLTISSGGVVSSAIGIIADGNVSDGFVTVTGAGSTWAMSGSTLFVGEDGTGTLIIQDDGAVSVGGGSGLVHVALDLSSQGTMDIGVGGPAGTLEAAEVRGGGGTAIIRFDHSETSYTFAPQLTGSLGVRHRGPGTTVLTADNSYTGDTNVRDGKLTIEQGLSAGGDVTVHSGHLEVMNGLLANGATITLEDGVLTADSIALTGGGTFAFLGGTLHVGIFNGNLTNQGGALAPGASAGSTTIIGNYTQQAGAKLEIEIGGTSAGGTYDLLNFTGMSILGGELQLAMLGGFAPSASDTFTVLNAGGGIFSVFANVTTGQRLTTVDGDGSFLVHYGPGSAFNQNQIVLSAFEAVLLPGDYNEDGVVDAADYIVWRKTLGQFGFALAADGNGNNEVDPGDYNIWRAHFGETAGAGAHVDSTSSARSAVPEPGTCFGFLMASGVLWAKKFAGIRRSMRA
ncbi:MAG: autotransporter-associated beta strand repeat-containing protein [Pirellulales bacterium]